jgi:hypothetical protein
MSREGKILEIIFLQVVFHCCIVHNALYYDTSCISFISELVLSSEVAFKSLCSRMRFVVDVINIDGGLPDFLGAFLLP